MVTGHKWAKNSRKLRFLEFLNVVSVFPIYVCSVIGSRLKHLYLHQRYHADERLSVFSLRASLLGPISSIRLDVMRDIQSPICKISVVSFTCRI